MRQNPRPLSSLPFPLLPLPFLFLVALLVALLVGCSGDGVDSSAEASPNENASASTEAANGARRATPKPPPAPEVLPHRGDPGFGPGFVVWESNRGGSWRLWRRDLDGTGPVPLTPEEPGKAHCCAHVAPHGRQLVYLALPENQAEYPVTGATGELRLLDLAGTAEGAGVFAGHPVARRARPYFEHRAAVWRNDREVIHIDGEGRTVVVDVEAGDPRELTTEALDAHGWLIDPTLSFATQGDPTFSPYDAENLAVEPRPSLGGCQPYCTADGRLGVWVAGAGGPIRAIDLRSRRQWPILAKGDERLPADRRYLYFPMPSRDNRFLAWAASHEEHDHTRADYDVFVAESRPETLELVGAPWPVTSHPSTDRFPTVWAAPLALGRHVGEAPFEARLDVPASARGAAEGWRWDLGGGQGQGQGRSARAVWSEPGRYTVLARHPAIEEELRGVVRVLPAAPPEIVAVDLRRRGDKGRGGKGGEKSSEELWIRFDEPVQVDGATIRPGAGPQVVSTRLEDDDTAWVATLSAPLERPVDFTLQGVRDRAEPPHALEATVVRVEPPRWPGHRDDLIFLWQSARHPNRFTSPLDGSEVTTVGEIVGRAFYDRHGALVLRGGALQFDIPSMDRLFHGARATNELSLEMTITPDEAAPETAGAIFAFAAGGRRNVTIAQQGDRLTLRLRLPNTGRAADRPVIDLGRVRAGEARHLLVSYTPGRLRAWLDGEETVDTAKLQDGFFHWQRTYLRVGAEGPGPNEDPNAMSWPWRGRVEGVAAYDRALDSEEATENARRYAEVHTRRDAVDTRRVRASLVERSRTPSLDEIAPYREALAVYEYRTTDGETLRVVHRVLLAGEPTGVAEMPTGRELRLELEPFDAQRQLESLFLSDDLPAAPEKTLYWSERLAP